MEHRVPPPSGATAWFAITGYSPSAAMRGPGLPDPQKSAASPSCRGTGRPCSRGVPQSGAGKVRSSAPEVAIARSKEYRRHIRSTVPGRSSRSRNGIRSRVYQVQVLIAEMIHRTDFVTGKSGRLRHMARGKSGNKDPAFHNSSVCFPAREGTIRILPREIPGRIPPPHRGDPGRARGSDLQWGWPVTATL